MTLSGRVISSLDLSGVLGFDTATKISSTTANSFYKNGYCFCIRYVSRSTPEPSGDLTNSEANTILDAGLALMVVQHVRASGWLPTGSLGTSDGSAAVSNCQAIGIPYGVTIWCDLEGVGNTTAQNVIDYCNNWYTAVNNAGYEPGLYVGANCKLDSTQLSNLNFVHFWKSASNAPGIGDRGYEMIQWAIDVSENGITIDKDTIGEDQYEDRPHLIIR